MEVDIRTLRRRLQAEGSSFRNLKDSVRRDIALERLRGTDLSVQEIAALTGFADSGSFRKAFHRWTGNYPSYYRR
jgi:AraC-like DNA-binding protein